MAGSGRFLRHDAVLVLDHTGRGRRNGIQVPELIEKVARVEGLHDIVVRAVVQQNERAKEDTHECLEIAAGPGQLAEELHGKLGGHVGEALVAPLHDALGLLEARLLRLVIGAGMESEVHTDEDGVEVLGGPVFAVEVGHAQQLAYVVLEAVRPHALTVLGRVDLGLDRKLFALGAGTHAVEALAAVVCGRDGLEAEDAPAALVRPGKVRAEENGHRFDVRLGHGREK